MLCQLKNQLSKILYDKLVQSLIIIFSVILGLARSLAYYILDKNEVNISILQSLRYAVICYIVLNLSYFIITLDYKVKPSEIKSPKKLWLIFFFVLLFSSILCWIAYWPGTVFIDNWYISRRGLDISVQHPIFYCAFVQFFISLGQSLGGVHYSVILYTGLQILIVSAALAALLFNIFQKRIPCILKYMSILMFFAIPLYAMYSIGNVKDVFWSLCLVGLTLLIYRFVTDNPVIKSKKFYIYFSLCLVGLIIFRNNGIYIAITCVFFLLCLKTHYRKYLFFLLLVCVLAQMANTFAMRMINKRPLFQEKVAAPIQQIAAVVKYDGNMTAEQKKFFEKLMPFDKMKELYNPYSVDSVKWTGRRYGFDYLFLQKNSHQFLKYWWQMMPNNFAIYVRAFLQETYWFWAPRQEGKVAIFINSIPEKGHDLYPWIMEHGYKQTHVISEKLENILKSYYLYAGYFLREGILFWLFLAMSLLYYLKHRKLRYLITFLPCFLLWATIMLAAPSARQFRYILPFAYLLPYFFCLLFIAKEDEDRTAPLKILSCENLSDKTKQRLNFTIKIFLIFFLLCGVYAFILVHIPLRARVDVSTKYTDDPMFHVRLDGQGVPVKEAEWMNKGGYRGVVTHQVGNGMCFTITALQDADITISLRGPDERDAYGKRYERWVKYTSFKINGELVVFGNKDVWHDKPFKYTLKAKKNNAYKVELKWRKK